MKSGTATSSEVPVTLSSTDQASYASRILKVAQSIDSAYLVQLSSQSKQNSSLDSASINSTDSLSTAASKLATAGQFSGAAVDAINGLAAESKKLHDMQAKDNLYVTAERVTSGDVTSTKAQDGTITVTVPLHFYYTYSSGIDGESIMPYKGTIKPGSTVLTNLHEVQDWEQYTNGGDPNSIASTPTQATSTASAADTANTTAAPQLKSSAAAAKVAQSATVTPSGRGRAVQYALDWAMKDNPDYRNWDGKNDSGDCTNFVSQAMYVGDWNMNTDLATYRNGYPVQWYYRDYDRWSGSWVRAQTFYERNYLAMGLLRNTQDRYALRGGDIMQIRLNGDSRMEHTVITTGYSNGMPYFSQHSSDHRNLSLD